MTRPLKILIADDEAIARNRLRTLLADCAEQLPTEVVGEADSGVAALENLARVDADVALLDIRMPGMDGMELARRIRHLPHPPAIIFVTAYDAHALAAFEVQAVDYLLKPVKLARLVEGLIRVSSHIDESSSQQVAEPRHFVVNDRGRVWRVPVDEVLYLRAELKYVTLRTREREYVLNEALSKLEEQYSADFVRIHRNCLINRHMIVGFELQRSGEESHWAVVLRDWPERLPVSRRQAHVIKAFRSAGPGHLDSRLGGNDDETPPAGTD
jgi:two-component system response regulator AlgR